mgnify:CR=1 FL=1
MMAAIDALVDEEVVEAVVAAMHSHPDQAMVTQNCCGMLWNIALGDAVWKYFAKTPPAEW